MAPRIRAGGESSCPGEIHHALFKELPHAFRFPGMTIKRYGFYTRGLCQLQFTTQLPVCATHHNPLVGHSRSSNHWIYSIATLSPSGSLRIS